MAKTVPTVRFATEDRIANLEDVVAHNMGVIDEAFGQVSDKIEEHEQYQLRLFLLLGGAYLLGAADLVFGIIATVTAIASRSY